MTLIVSRWGTAHREAEPSFYVSRSPWLTDQPSEGVTKCGRWIDLYDDVPVKTRCGSCFPVDMLPGAEGEGQSTPSEGSVP